MTHDVHHDTNILILGGFLGSGKTTVLLDLVKHIVKNSEKETPVAILENEIGEVDVDGGAVNSAGYAVKSLYAGCACCELLGQLPFAVEEIINDMSPEVLIIETTGLAVPSSMIDALRYLSCEVRTCILVDAARWDRIHKPLENLLKEQLQSAQVIVINKCDLVDDATLEQVKQSALQYAGGTKPLICVSAQEGLTASDVASMLGKD